MTNSSNVGNEDLQNELFEYLTDFFFGGLTSASDSKDTAFLVIRRLMKGKTREEFLDFAKICAKNLVNKLVSRETNLDNPDILEDPEIDKLINESLFESYDEYQNNQ